MDVIENPVEIVIAEDEEADFKLMERSFKKMQISNPIKHVSDGRELIDYLKSKDMRSSKCLVLLDLNMPGMDGREALRTIREDDSICHVPIVILTTSNDGEDILSSYRDGGNSFVRKPISQEEFLRVVTMLEKYWLQIVELPQAL